VQTVIKVTGKPRRFLWRPPHRGQNFGCPARSPIQSARNSNIKGIQYLGNYPSSAHTAYRPLKDKETTHSYRMPVILLTVSRDKQPPVPMVGVTAQKTAW